MASGQYEGPEGGRIRADSNNLFFFGQIVSKPEHRWSLWQKLVPDFRFPYWNSEDMHPLGYLPKRRRVKRHMRGGEGALQYLGNT